MENNKEQNDYVDNLRNLANNKIYFEESVVNKIINEIDSFEEDNIQQVLAIIKYSGYIFNIDNWREMMKMKNYYKYFREPVFKNIEYDNILIDISLNILKIYNDTYIDLDEEYYFHKYLENIEYMCLDIKFAEFIGMMYLSTASEKNADMLFKKYKINPFDRTNYELLYKCWSRYTKYQVNWKKSSYKKIMKKYFGNYILHQ